MDGHRSSSRSLKSTVLSRLSDPTIFRSVESSSPMINQREAAALTTPMPVWRSHSKYQIDKITDDTNSKDEERDGKKRKRHYYSYLDLRLTQNTSWATTRLQNGVEHAKRGQDESLSVEALAKEMTKAEKCYKEGLDLIPNHPELLVAYGALCGNLGRDEEAMELLRRAVNVTEPYINAGERFLDDNRHPNNDKKVSSTRDNARKYLAEVERRIQIPRSMSSIPIADATYKSTTHPPSTENGVLRRECFSYKKSKGGEARAEQALRDALAERAFLSGGSMPLDAECWGDKVATNGHVMNDNHRTEKMPKKKGSSVRDRERKRKHRHRRDDDKKRSKKKRKRRKHKMKSRRSTSSHRYDMDYEDSIRSEDDYSSVDYSHFSSEDSSRRKSRRKKRKRSHAKKYDDEEKKRREESPQRKSKRAHRFESHSQSPQSTSSNVVKINQKISKIS